MALVCSSGLFDLTLMDEVGRRTRPDPSSLRAQVSPLDFNDEEILAYYITFLKSLALPLVCVPDADASPPFDHLPGPTKLFPAPPGLCSSLGREYRIGSGLPVAARIKR